MVRPSSGRVDHSIGYIKGNFAWQEYSDNSKESHLRNISKMCDTVSSAGKRQRKIPPELIRHMRTVYNNKKNVRTLGQLVNSCLGWLSRSIISI